MEHFPVNSKHLKPLFSRKCSIKTPSKYKKKLICLDRDFTFFEVNAWVLWIYRFYIQTVEETSSMKSSWLPILSIFVVFMAFQIKTTKADGYGHGGHGHGGHKAQGTACIVKGSYCNCHYCKCEKGHVHCGGYGKGGYGKLNAAYSADSKNFMAKYCNLNLVWG